MGVVLDTNVVSELAKSVPDDGVLAWARTLRSEELFLPAVCWAELRRGINLLPAGRRRERLERSLEELVDGIGGVLSFGRAEAEAYGELTAQPGRPRPTVDAMIAASCLTADMPLATRNTKDFLGCGIELIDPWVRTAGS